MKQDSMPVEQEGMAFAAEAPVLDNEDTPKVDDSVPAEETLESSPAVETTSEGEALEVDSPVVSDTPEEGTVEENPLAQEGDKETVHAEDGQALAAPAPEEAVVPPAQTQEKANVFSKVWSILIAKSEITVPLLFVFSLVLGLIIGYSVWGDGPVKDVFDPETWTHIVKLIFG